MVGGFSGKPLISVSEFLGAFLENAGFCTAFSSGAHALRVLENITLLSGGCANGRAAVLHTCITTRHVRIDMSPQAVCIWDAQVL